MRTSTYGKNSFKYAAAVLWNVLKILKHAIAMVRILLTFRDGTSAFSNNSSYVLS
jgi:hypothetical protein